MKFITLAFLIIASTSLYAGNSDVTKLDDDVETQRADKVIKSMCRGFHGARTLGVNDSKYEPHNLLKEAVATFHEIDINSKDINHKVQNFWNKYNDRLICRFADGVNKNLRGRHSGIHFAKLVIHHRNSPELFTRYLLSKKNGIKINVNSIETTNGEQETIIDYIDKILNEPKAHLRYNVKRVKKLRKRLIRKNGALRASEILDKRDESTSKVISK